MEEMSYVLSFTFFLLSLIFSLHWWPLAFLILSPPVQNVAIPFGLPYLLIELFYIGMPVVRTVGPTVTWLPNFLGKRTVDYHIFLPMGLRCARSAKKLEVPKKSYIGQRGYLPLRVSKDAFKWKCQKRFVTYKTSNRKTVFKYSSMRLKTESEATERLSPHTPAA